MSRPIVKRAKAWSDVLGHAQYMDHDSPDAADRFVDAVDDSIDFLGSFPEIGARLEIDHPRLSGLRIWPVKGFARHLIVYHYANDEIEILRVVHASQDLTTALLG